MRIALVHDDFIQQGGAESLFATMASLWPDAPIYTSLIDWSKLPSSISRNRVRPSFIQKIPLATKLYKVLLPLYPLAFESFNFDEFDLVISSTTRFAKAIITKPKTVHICYINTIPRFIWQKHIQEDYLPTPTRILMSPLLSWLKRWDRIAAKRVDYYIANSEHIRRKLKEIYDQEAKVIYPFADLTFFRPTRIFNWQLKSQNYYLTVSRLVKWKKIDLAIKVAQELGFNLKIVGSGPDAARLRKIAFNGQQSTVNNQIEFVGKVQRSQLRQLYQNAKALIVTQEEDFGIAAVEAITCGCPVIAYAESGASEIVIEGQTGVLFKTQSVDSLKDAIIRLSKVKLTISAIDSSTERFAKNVFVRKLKKAVGNYV